MVALVRRKWQYYELRARRRERGQYYQYYQYQQYYQYYQYCRYYRLCTRRRKRGHPIISSHFLILLSLDNMHHGQLHTSRTFYSLSVSYFKYGRIVINCFDGQILFTVCLTFEAGMHGAAFFCFGTGRGGAE